MFKTLINWNTCMFLPRVMGCDLVMSSVHLSQRQTFNEWCMLYTAHRLLQKVQSIFILNYLFLFVRGKRKKVSVLMCGEKCEWRNCMKVGRKTFSMEKNQFVTHTPLFQYKCQEMMYGKRDQCETYQHS